MKRGGGSHSAEDRRTKDENLTLAVFLEDRSLLWATAGRTSALRSFH